MLPAKTTGKWLVSPSGAVEKWSPAPPQPARQLTRYQKHRLYREGLAHVLQFMTALGFRCNCIEQATTSISLQKGNFSFDVSIRDPATIAYVTSNQFTGTGNRVKAGHDIAGNPIYEPKATVRFASNDITSDFVIQIIGSRVFSSKPIFVELTDDIQDPVRHIMRQVVGVLATFMSDSQVIVELNKETRGELLKELQNSLALQLLNSVPTD